MVLLPFLLWGLISLSGCVGQVVHDDLLQTTIYTLLDKSISLLVRQNRSNVNGPKLEFKDYALNDDVNDDLIDATTQELISCAGFNYENHYVLSLDGYITQMVRIINPLADPKQLKQPPIALYHGAISNPAIHVWGSVKQHHPEPWPRSASDGPFTSSNRSIGFVLANNGYDVWLVGIRGSDISNSGHIEYKIKAEFMKKTGLAKITDNIQSNKYWQFSQDEIIKYELPAQINKILELTGASKLSLFTLSISTQLTMSMMASNEDIRSRIHNYVLVAPIINSEGTNQLVKKFQLFLRVTPPKIGTLIITQFLLSQPIRNLMVAIAREKRLRYTILWALLVVAFGPSPVYQTLLELPVINHILKPTSFLVAKQYSQQMAAKKLQYFDYGPIENEIHYGTLTPKEYAPNGVPARRTLVVSTSNDILGTESGAHQTVSTILPAPKHIVIQGYNHLDSYAACDNDIKVNLPILKFLDEDLLEPLDDQTLEKARRVAAKPSDLEKYVPFIKSTLTKSFCKEEDNNFIDSTLSSTRTNVISDQ